MRILMLLFVFVLISSTKAFCDNPQNILVFIQDGQIELVVSHPVEDPAEHYIEKIEVTLNGKIAAEKDFTSQTDEKTQQTVIEFLATKKGDVLWITAYCNKFGRLTKKLTIGKEK